jgi:hypothetical protein
VHLGPGIYPENVLLGGNHGGLAIVGAGAGADPASASHLIGQGGAANLDVLLITVGGPDAAHPTTVRNLRISSPGGAAAVSGGLPYGGITLDATPAAPLAAGLLRYVCLSGVATVGVTGEGTGCGILVTGSSPDDLVSGVVLAGCQATANGHAGLLVTGTRAADLTIGSDSLGCHSAFSANGGSGLCLLGDPAPLPGQFTGLALSETTFCDNGPYDIELRHADTNIDATRECVFVGASCSPEIEARVWHQVDDAALGLVTFAAPNLAGNRLSWDPRTRRMTLGGSPLSTGQQWYDLCGPGGPQVRILVLGQANTASATVQAIDPSGGEHHDAIPMTLRNTLRYTWYLKGTALTRVCEVSNLGGREQTGTYEASLNRTTYGRTVLPGLWVYAHVIVSWDTLLRETERR